LTFGVASFFQRSETKDRATLMFLSQLQNISLELYESILNTFSQKLEFLLLPTFLGRTSSDGKNPKPTSKKSGQEVSRDISDITNVLDSCVALLIDNKNFPSLVKDVFIQIFEFLDETVFNGLVQQKRLYSTDGVRLKVLSLNLDQWIRSSSHFLWIRQQNVELFKFVQEVANLLMIDKEKLVSESFIKSTFKCLEMRHIVHFVDIFATDETSRKPAPASVTKALFNMFKNSSSDKTTSSIGLLRKGSLVLHLPV